MSSDNFSVRVVVCVLGVGVLIGLVAMAYLSFTGTAIPDPLDRLTTLMAGALIGVLAKTSTAAEQVQVVNEPDQPVPVEPAP